MKRVAFVLDDASWLGGVNYYRNLITSIAMLPDPEIQIVAFLGSEISEEIGKSYGDIQVVRSNVLNPKTILGFMRRVVRKIGFQNDYMLEFLLLKHRIDVVSHFSGQFRKNTKLKCIGWIPDFQHLHLPEFFDKKDHAAREVSISAVTKNSDVVILSSKNAERDLHSLIAGAANKTRVLKFVPDVQMSECDANSFGALEYRYGFSGNYVYLPNQFWVHKNHKLVLEALSILKARKIDVTVIASGSPKDHRFPEHFDQLLAMAKNMEIEESFRMIGIVPYGDLLSLMMHSTAVLNPSLFEGWSTTVEEAKALGKVIVLSDIPVHREQNPRFGIYFDPTDPIDLSQKLAGLVANCDKTNAQHDIFLNKNDHRQKRVNFAITYQEIVLELFVEQSVA